MTDRAALAARQHRVLDDLLAGRVPTGFDPVASALTTRVLHRKRSDAAVRACPELDDLPGWRDRFHAWAAAHPQHGCAHDDVCHFAAAVHDQEPGWVALHRLYDGVGRDGRPRRVTRRGRPALGVRIAGRVLVVDLPVPTLFRRQQS